jgi:hypothetical protein
MEDRRRDDQSYSGLMLAAQLWGSATIVAVAQGRLWPCCPASTLICPQLAKAAVRAADEGAVLTYSALDGPEFLLRDRYSIISSARTGASGSVSPIALAVLRLTIK